MLFSFVFNCTSLIGAELHVSLQTLVRRIDDVSEKMSRLLKPLMCPINDRLGQSLQPGVDTVGWLSNTADEFVVRAGDAVTDWEQLISRATQLIDQRILARFRDIESTILCPMSSTDEPFTVEQFLDYVRVN